MLPNCRKFSRESPGYKEKIGMSREELSELLDARDKLCGFCKNDACEKCQVTALIDDAYAECDEIDE